MRKTLAVVVLTAVMCCMSSASRSLKEDCAEGDATCFCTANPAGYYADLATGCQYYYWCMSEGQGSYIPCGAGTLFRQDVHICDYTDLVSCGGTPASPSSSAPTATQAPAGPAEEAAPASPAEEQPSPAPAAPAAAASNPSCDVNEPSWPGASGVAAYVSPGVWCQMFVHTGDSVCSPGFYTYSAFIDSTRAFPDFGNAAGDAATNKREIAAFLAQISHETTGGPLENNQYDWGLCFHEEQSPPSNYCVPDPAWPCAANASYHGRGPIQLSYNYNYGQVGQDLGIDLLNRPSLVSSNGTIAFETALWFWMTPQPPKPSAHDVIIGRYQPTQTDIDAGRVDGFGLTTNIINGGLECGPDNAKKEHQWAKQVDRMNYFKRYAELLGTDVGDNLDCAGQQPFSAVPVVASASLAAAPSPAPGAA